MISLHKKASLLFLGLIVSANVFAGEVEAQLNKKIGYTALQQQDDCITTLQFLCLCAQKIRTNFLSADTVCTNDLKANRACIDALEVRDRACINWLKSSLICADRLQAANLCVSGDIVFGQAEICQRFRATVVFGQDTLYALGSPLAFDVILDDPNGDVSLAFSNAVYTAPVSGYYIVTLQLDQHDLEGDEIILGTPVANPQILVNGVPFRQSFTPFLTFHNEQDSTITALVSLEAGDQVSARYDVYVVTDAAGFSPYVGTVIVEGNGSEENQSVLKIHYLSSDCGTQPCTPCPFECPSICNQIVCEPC